MKYRPALFNTPMVYAIEEGRKNTTRRLVRLPGKDWEILAAEKRPGADATGTWELTIHGTIGGLTKDFIIHEDAPCLPGDILWVRETWTEDGQNFYYRADFESDWLDPCETLSGGYPIYCSYHPGCEGCMREKQRINWRPSIHMPKEAARIFLQVTGIRLERLQDIDENGVCDEGAESIISACEHMDYSVIPPEPCFNVHPCKNCIINYSYPELFGKMVWDKTIKPADLPRHGWAANPWVWVIEFERIPKPDDWNKRSEQK